MHIKLTVRPRQVAIQTPFIRLCDLLKLAAVTPSGGLAKHMIQQGQVEVNGSVCTQRGKKIRPGDRVTVNGTVLEVTDHDGN